MSKGARQLLREAAVVLDRHPRLLRAAGSVRSFHAGGRWMRLGLRALRTTRMPRLTRSLEALGWRKYLTCVACAAGWAVICLAFGTSWLLPLCIVAFYVAEIHRLFAFPLAIDRVDDPRAVHAGLLDIVRPHDALLTVMVLACVMLLGGILGRGFVRSWCLGCMAVLIWYEDARRALATDVL